MMPNKEVEKRARDLHSDLLDELSYDLGKPQVKRFKERLRSGDYGGFRAREIEEMKDMETIFTAQQRREVFSVGKYEKLKEQLEKAKCYKHVGVVETFEGKLRDIGYPVVVRAESMDASPSDYNTKSSVCHVSPLSPHTATSPDFPFRRKPNVCYPPGKGYVLYISNFFETPDNSGRPRPGVKNDHKNIENFFKEGYDLDFRPDIQTVDKLWEVITEVKTKVEHIYNSFFLIISSHGKGITLKDDNGKVMFDNEKNPVIISEGIHLVKKDTLVRVDEIVSKFENFMLGKPKVLIFQACRSLTEKPDSHDQASFYDADPYSPVTIPGNADMLIIHDTSRGHKGWRNEEGSWLISCMFSQLKDQYKTEHLLDVLTQVNRELSLRETYATDGKGPGKQMPCFMSTFTKFFYVK